MDKITLGSGKLYALLYNGSIPEIEEIAVEKNRIMCYNIINSTGGSVK